VPTGRIYNRRHEIFTGPTVQALSDQIEFDRPLSPEAVIQSTRRLRLRQAENGHKRTLAMQKEAPPKRGLYMMEVTAANIGKRWGEGHRAPMPIVSYS